MDYLTGVIGESPEIAAIRETLGRLLRRQRGARRLPSLLIQGETGTGKGLLARAVHDAGPSSAAPFVHLNCAAIPETLLEAELFGFERGAFTDARHAKPGLFHAAHGGTLFLDEIGLLPEALQTKLLTVIEDRVVRRLGSTRSEAVDVWILAATSENLEAARRSRRFHEALYHRLSMLIVRLPPLRERGRDVLLLADHFLARACAAYHLSPKRLAPDAREALQAYRWPGNVRELANVIERVALLTEGPVVTASSLGLAPEPRANGRPPGAAARQVSLCEAVQGVERDHLLAALGDTGWNISHAAARLGVPRNTLRYRIQKHGLRRPEGPDLARLEIERPAMPESAAAVDREVAAAAQALTAGPASPAVRCERRHLALIRGLVRPIEETATAATSGPLAFVSEMAEKVRSFGGRLTELSPTGLGAVFGLEPVEDAARRAALAALAIRESAEQARSGARRRFAITVVIHTDQFMVDRVGGAEAIDLDGEHQAQALLTRLATRVEPGATIVTETASRLLARRFDLVPWGRLEHVPGRLWRLAGRERTGLARGAAAAPFVGRRQELALLESRWAAVLRGQGQVVGIVGEPGIGKSRLLLEFREHLAGRAVTWLEGRGLPSGSAAAYHPLLHLVTQQCGITEADPPETIAAKVRETVQTCGLRDERAAYLLRLMGVPADGGTLALLSPEAVKRGTFETLRELSVEASRRQPLVMVVEDLHWIDQTSEAYLASLVERLPGASILLVTTHRPGYRPPWLEKSYATQLALHPLSPEESREIVQAILPTASLVEPFAEEVLAKAEGNPFFLEELARGVAAADADGASRTVPATIQEVLQARIDRLADAPRRLLQIAAVLGRACSMRLLRLVWPTPQELEPHLQTLVRLEFLVEQRDGEEPGYRFKHALTQEVAYASLLPADREVLHAAAGRALERLYADRPEAAAERLAHHYARTAEAEKATTYLALVAEQAARGFAHAEATVALTEALRQAERLPAEAERDRHRVSLILRLAHSLYFLGRFEESFDLLSRERERVDRLDDPRLAGPYHFILGRGYNFLGEHDRAVFHASRALEAAARSGDGTTRGKARYVLAVEAHWAGWPREGIVHAREAVALLERASEPFWLAQAHRALGFNYYLVGDFERALTGESHAHTIGMATGDPQLQSHTLWTTGWIESTRGEWAAGVDACRRGLDRAPDPSSTALALGYLGLAYLEQGDAAPAIPLLEQAVRQLGDLGFRRSQGRFTTFLADACRLIGQLERAQELARRGLESAGATGCRPAVGWAQRTLGRIAQARGASAEAERALADALETFGAMGARFEAGRTHLALAELAHEHRRPDVANRHLSEARETFVVLRVPRYVKRAGQLAEAWGWASA